MRECCYFRTLPSCCFRSGPATCFYLQCLIPRVEMNFLIKPNPSQKQESLVREQQLLHSANIILYFIITFSMFDKYCTSESEAKHILRCGWVCLCGLYMEMMKPNNFIFCPVLLINVFNVFFNISIYHNL